MKYTRSLFILLITFSIFVNNHSNSGEKQRLSENELNKISFRFINQEAIIPPAEIGKYVPVSGNIEQLKYFFNSLKETKNKKIRIAHFGDSQIQGDIITAYIREKLQSNYGGKGAGYISIQSNDIRMRLTTEHSFSDDWNYAAVITRNPESLPFGMSGSVAVPKPGSWVKYKATNYLKSSSSFETARLFYSNADNSSTIEYKINNGNAVKVNLASGKEIQELVINTKTSAVSLEIKFLSGKQPYFYGVSLEAASGIYVDNFPMPGNTGASLLDIPYENLIGFNKLLNYSLIILSYGNNVSLQIGVFTLFTKIK
jgi:hypothetical protein